MSEQTWTYMDKSTWSDGPWQHEPDKIHWIDPQSDLDCLIVRGPLGALCGYVGVPPEHRCHGERYEHIELAAHGGLTYSALCCEDGQICHAPAPGREANLWWFGFDCAHAFDFLPTRNEWMTTGEDRDIYRDIVYVRAEVASLAQQLAALDTKRC